MYSCTGEEEIHCDRRGLSSWIRCNVCICNCYVAWCLHNVFICKGAANVTLKDGTIVTITAADRRSHKNALMKAEDFVNYILFCNVYVVWYVFSVLFAHFRISSGKIGWSKHKLAMVAVFKLHQMVQQEKDKPWTSRLLSSSATTTASLANSIRNHMLLFVVLLLHD